MQIWQNHIDLSEQVRNKMNFSAFSKTYKVNREQAAKGDLTVLDRVEQDTERVKN
jgi:hypothetical protein